MHLGVDAGERLAQQRLLFLQPIVERRGGLGSGPALEDEAVEHAAAAAATATTDRAPAQRRAGLLLLVWRGSGTAAPTSKGSSRRRRVAPLWQQCLRLLLRVAAPLALPRCPPLGPQRCLKLTAPLQRHAARGLLGRLLALAPARGMM